MDIEYRRKNPHTWIVEVWDEPIQKMSGLAGEIPLPEEQYVEINDWCKESFGYHARTAYHIFELRKQSHLDWFILRWT